MPAKNFEELYRKREEMALEGVAKGLPLVASVFRDGIVLVTRNTSRGFNKIREVHDAIAFGAAGARYPEIGFVHRFLEGTIREIEALLAPEDVDARFLAEVLMEHIHSQFVDQRRKPYEIAVVLTEVLAEGGGVLYRLNPNGAMEERDRFVCVAGEETQTAMEKVLQELWRDSLAFAEALGLCKEAFEKAVPSLLAEGVWEIGVLERPTPSERKFRYVKEGEENGARETGEARAAGRAQGRSSSTNASRRDG